MIEGLVLGRRAYDGREGIVMGRGMEVEVEGDGWVGKEIYWKEEIRNENKKSEAEGGTGRYM